MKEKASHSARSESELPIILRKKSWPPRTPEMANVELLLLKKGAFLNSNHLRFPLLISYFFLSFIFSLSLPLRCLVLEPFFRTPAFLSVPKRLPFFSSITFHGKALRWNDVLSECSLFWAADPIGDDVL